MIERREASAETNLRAQIRDLERECGCQSGALVGFVVLIAYVVAVGLLGAWSAWAPTAAIGFGLFAVGVGGGKAWALRRVGKQRDRLIMQLARRSSGAPLERSRA